MSFYRRYELDRLVADGDAKTFRAIDNETGRVVLLHMFNPKGQAVLAALKAKLAVDPQRPTPPLLELGEFAGSPYAVTEEVPGFRDIREWVVMLSNERPGAGNDTPPPSTPRTPPQAPQTRPNSPLRAPSRPGSTTDQFNHLFDDEPASPAPAQVFSPQPYNPQPPPREPGEFTRTFGLPVTNEPLLTNPKSASGDPLPDAAKPVSQNEPGEFTRLFGGSSSSPSTPLSSSKPQPQPADLKPAPGQSEPGEFTRVFRLSEDRSGALQATPKADSPHSDPPPPVASHEVIPPKPPAAADDFEKMFGPAPVSAPAPVESRQRGGEFTGLFGMGHAAEAINIEEEQARAARSAAPEQRPFQAPSEFTRRFGPEEGARIPPTIRRAGVRTTGGSASGLFGSQKELMEKSKALGSSRPDTGPGEYTRVIARPGANQAPNPPAPAPAPLPAPKRNWVLVLAIGLPVLALMVFAIIAMVVRSR